MSQVTVRKGQFEYDGKADGASDNVMRGRVRRPGGGRKPAVQKQPGLLPELEELLKTATYGDPQRVITWTTLSLRKISESLRAKGFVVSHTVIGQLLEQLGYSKQVNQKMLQVSDPHPDRDAQFQFINAKSKAFLEKGDPVISIDSKKKENIGNFKNNGGEYRPKGDPRQVLDHDFQLPELEKVAPYGVYVVNDNTAFVNLSTSSDTAEFAGESIWRWWDCVGRPSFGKRRKLFITLRWRRKQWLPYPSVEGCAGALGRTNRSGDPCFAPAPGHVKMEQNRASALLLHQQELAGATAHQH